jgi:hypothetical protein
MWHGQAKMQNEDAENGKATHNIAWPSYYQRTWSSFPATGYAAGHRFGGMFPVDRINLHRDQNLLQLGEYLVAIDMLNAVFGAESGVVFRPRTYS